MAKCSLHKDEYEYFKTLKYEARRSSYLLGRYSAKQAVSALTGEKKLTRINIKQGIFNQPVVACESAKNIQVSLAHCDDFAVAVAFDSLLIMGIDFEKACSERSSSIEAELTAHEMKLAHQSSFSYEHYLFLLWTIKESLSKVLKTGLTVPLNILEVQSIEVREGYYTSTFTHFFQYCSLSWIVDEYIFSLTLPKNLTLQLDINRLKTFLMYRIIRQLF